MICGCVTAVAIVAAAVIVAYRMGANREIEPIVQVIERGSVQRAGTVGGRGVLLTPENMDAMRVGEEISPRATHFTTSMNTHWIFPNGSTQASSNATVGNSTFNYYTVYFDVFLIETGELLYASPFMPVGARVEGFALEVELPPGSHNAIAIFHLVDDDFEEISDVSINIAIHVE